MEKKISNELSEQPTSKQTPQDKPQSTKSSVRNVPVKRSSISQSKKSTSTARKQSETGLSRRSEKKLEHENITVGSLEESKHQMKSRADSKGSGSAKPVVKKVKLSKKGTGDTANKDGIFARQSSPSAKKDQSEAESVRQSTHLSKTGAQISGRKSAGDKRSSSAKSPKIKEDVNCKTKGFPIKSGNSEKGQIPQTQTNEERKEKELLVEGSVITGKGDVEGFDKLQNSINNLSIDADHELDTKGLDAQDESKLPQKAEEKKEQKPTEHDAQANQGIASLQISQQIVDSEVPTPLVASIEFKDKKPASPASKAPRIGITIPSNDAFDTPNIGNESPVGDVPSPGAMSTGPRLYANPTSRDSRQNSGRKFGIKLHQVEQQESTEHIPNKEKKNVNKKAQATTTHDEENKSTSVRPKKIVPEPLPLLPKVTTVFSMPPKCPMESIKFIQLKRFQVFAKQLAEHMSPGFDLVGNRRKMIQLRTEERVNQAQAKGKEVEQLAKMDDSTHYIRSIVYAKDPSIIDAEQQHTHQRTAFGHLNNLDIKTLIMKKELFGEEKGGFSSISPRAINRRFNQPKEPILDPQVYKLTGEDDKTLVFESRFESGNLYLAQKVSEAEYNLLMSNDVNTQGHTQWFFFQVKNTRKKSKIRFNLLNYSKPDSLFNYGMKVSVYSEKKAEKHNIGWHKGGDDIRYFQNGIRKDITYYSKSFYTATFQYNFEHDMDTVYFAYSIPYTYSDLRNDLASIETDPGRSQHVQKKTLCKTLSGENCEILTITSRDNLENFSQRKGVVLTARVHPGETVGSWMMRGVLSFLTDPNNYEAKLLRENFVFKVIPMLNPDGVINGNYRCSLAGCDLNRRWKAPSKVLHPTIYHTKKLVKQIHQERQCVLFCDLHGHSRKQNVFMYGCNNKQNPGETRIFPFILSKMNDFFCFEYSRFGNQKSKEATARLSLYKELKSVPNIYTMESSFAGCDEGPSAGKHFTTEMLETLGHDCCRALLIYCNLYVPPELADLPYFKGIIARKKAAAEAALSNKKNFKEDDKVPSFNDAIMKEFKNNSALLAQDSDSSSGSESAPSEDNMQAEELVKQLPVIDTTLKKQIKKNQELKKREENNQNNIQSQVKLRRKSSGENLKRQNTNMPRNPSPIKRAQPPSPEKIMPEKPEEEKKKKPKVETRDACTQTDRSDYQLIKAKMMREQQLKAQYNQTGPLKAQEASADKNKSDRKRSYPPNKARQVIQYQGQGPPLSQVQHPAALPGGIHNHPPAGLTQIQTSPMATNSKLSNMTGVISGNRQVVPLDGKTEPNQKLMPSQAKYSFMGVSSVKQSNGITNNTTGSHQGAVSVSQSQQPNSNFQTEHPMSDGLRPGYGTEPQQNPMQKSGFSEKTGNTKDSFGKEVHRINSDHNSGFRYHSSIHDAPQGLSPARKAPVSVSNAQSMMMINQAERAEQELKLMQQNIQRNASRIEETLRINQHASRMEIDQNAMRGTGTGDPNFKIDCTSIGGKPQMPTVTSLSGGYESSHMSPIQKAGHTVSGGNPNVQNSSIVISQGGPNGVGAYIGSSKIGSATSNYATLQLTQENNEHGRIGMFSPNAQTVKNGKQIFQLPQANTTAAHSIHQQQLSINLDSYNQHRKASATCKDQKIAQTVGQVAQSNYQIGSVSGFNQQNPVINNAQAQGSINVSGRRLKQQPEPNMVVRNNCGHNNNNFGSLMTSPVMLKGQNPAQGQFSLITEQTQQKRHGGTGAANQPLRASLSKNKSGGWPPNTSIQAPQGYVQPQIGQIANVIQVGGQSPITMTGLSQYRHQQQVAGISQGSLHQNHDKSKLPALNTRSMPKPINKDGIDWPGGNNQYGIASPSQHLQVQQSHGNAILGQNMIVTSGGQLQNINQNNKHGTSQVASNYQVAAHQKYMGGSILQVTSAASAQGKNGGSQHNPVSIGQINSTHKVSHSGNCHQPFVQSKQANSTSSANHKRNQGVILSMGQHGVDLGAKPAQKTSGARTPGNSNIIKDGSYRQFSKDGPLLQSKDAPPVHKPESNQ